MILTTLSLRIRFFSDSLRAGLGPQVESEVPWHLPNAIIRVSIKRNVARCGGFVTHALKQGRSSVQVNLTPPSLSLPPYPLLLVNSVH